LTWALRSSPSIDCRTSAVVDICLEHDLNRIGLYPYLAADLRLYKIFLIKKNLSHENLPKVLGIWGPRELTQFIRMQIFWIFKPVIG